MDKRIIRYLDDNIDASSPHLPFNITACQCISVITGVNFTVNTIVEWSSTPPLPPPAFTDFLTLYVCSSLPSFPIAFAKRFPRSRGQLNDDLLYREQSDPRVELVPERSRLLWFKALAIRLSSPNKQIMQTNYVQFKTTKSSIQQTAGRVVNKI